MHPSSPPARSWLARLRHPAALRRIGLGCALLASVLLVPLPASGGLLWDAGIALGYAALVCAAVLYLYPLRGDGLPHRRLFTLSQHRRIGWIALTLGGLHAAALLIIQPQIWHYLLPSAPYYMLCGLAALIILAVLVATGLSARKALRKVPATDAPPASVSSHAVLAALLLALSGAHIVGSGQLADRTSKIIVVCLLLVLPLSWMALRGVRQRRSHPSGRSKSSIWTTVLPCCAAAAVLLTLPVPTPAPKLLKQPTPPARLAVTFPHEKHGSVNCVACHHNFVDKTGLGSCLDCHRSARTDLPQSAEATFHLFCRNCHAELARTTPKHGPTRACSACHLREGEASTLAESDLPAAFLFSSR
ncbi:MAG TPA: cytochrome c3 family protein [Steroidobacteraceae bacterium]|nr:cytochrome c3 family protein [Steroidobacteraceae bacterium]